MEQFKDRAFEHRFKLMGDLAEQAFETSWKKGFVRYGLNRPPLKMSSLPLEIRHTPDYLTSSHLVEVQGIGKDQKLKLKLDKWKALDWWNMVHPLLFFIYDSFNDRVTMLEWETLTNLCKDAEIETFKEGKKYYAVPATLIWVNGET
tara:strand:- start:1714 stop:2154 length:441 start_codon:yes stop_codon:yes gene_type:complete